MISGTLISIKQIHLPSICQISGFCDFSYRLRQCAASWSVFKQFLASNKLLNGIYDTYFPACESIRNY